MRHFAAGVSTALALLSRGAILIAGLAMVAMTGVVAWGVFGRFVLNDTPAWAEASALLLMAWVILGAAAVGVREGFHMGFETLRDILPEPLRRLCMLASDLTITVFGGALAWYGLELALGVWNATLPTLGLPGTVEYLPITLGGLIMGLFGLERLLSHLMTGKPPAGLPEHALLTDS
jgi:TRAP-type C4-dicarboxylate transport system permease small subunit